MLKNLFVLIACLISLCIASTGLCQTEKYREVPAKPGVSPGLTVAKLPDLVVTSLKITGEKTMDSKGSIGVPISVVVKNQGTAPAGIFKVATEYKGPDGNFVVAFTVPGQSDIWYPHTHAQLAPNREVSFSGKVTFPSSLRGKTVYLSAIADSCSGDEFMPDYCRVGESNEDNNESVAITLTLPRELTAAKPPELPFKAPPIKTKPVLPEADEPPVRAYAQGAQPDLVVTALNITGGVTMNSTDDYFEVPIRVVVKNQGTAPAGIFKVSIEYKEPGHPYNYTYFITSPEQSKGDYCPFTNALLEPGKEVSFSGKVILYAPIHAPSVYLKAIADGCAGSGGSVAESNEDNNESREISVQTSPAVSRALGEAAKPRGDLPSEIDHPGVAEALKPLPDLCLLRDVFVSLRGRYPNSYPWQIRIDNIGTADAPPSTALVELGDFDTGEHARPFHLLRSFELPIPAIRARSHVTIPSPFNLPSECWNPQCRISITVDNKNLVKESNENNNVRAIDTFAAELLIEQWR